MQILDQEIISRKNEDTPIYAYIIIGYALIISASILLGVAGGTESITGVLLGIILGLVFMAFLIIKYNDNMVNNKVASLLNVSRIESYIAVVGAMQYIYDIKLVGARAMIVNKSNLVYVVKRASKADLKRACELSKQNKCDKILFVKDGFHGNFVGEKEISTKYNVEFYSFRNVAHTLYGRAKHECDLL